MLKMLIVDSSDDFRYSLEELFCNSYRVMCCANGKDAAELLASWQPDILILDLLLPDLDGISVLHSALKSNVRPKVLATTRFVNDYILTMFHNMNVDYMMVKPCDMNALAARVKDLKDTLTYPLSLEQIEVLAVKHLNILEIPAHLDGYQYAKTGLALLVKHPYLRLFNELYAQIMEIHGCKNEKLIDRSFFSAIKAAWCEMDTEIWAQYFKPEADGHIPRPCNRLFLNRLVDKINQDIFEQYQK